MFWFGSEYASVIVRLHLNKSSYKDYSCFTHTGIVLNTAGGVNSFYWVAKQNDEASVTLHQAMFYWKDGNGKNYLLYTR